MIISKTPYRISFFGGASDYPEWFKKDGNKGEVISVTIDKYVYLSIRELKSFFGYKFRLSYSKIEETNYYNHIKHKALKALIKHYKPKVGLEIHYDGDLPARSGMGSSSSFTVGAINAYYNLINKKINKKKLADESINFEQKILNENVGIQDQLAASYGGFNLMTFTNQKFNIKNFDIKKKFFKNLNKNLFLIYTGQQRFANEIANSFVNKLDNSKKKNILKILEHVKLAKKIIKNESLDDFGYLLNETWEEKKKLSGLISNEIIDDMYKLGIKNGSLGGKLLGAGNGGFMLFYVPKEKHKKFTFAFRKFINISFNFTKEGSTIIFKN
jgi:D-glycero-alpha-D-manno-heptose-7-phosphate kinase